jgi:hypothetical protein
MCLFYGELKTKVDSNLFIIGFWGTRTPGIVPMSFYFVIRLKITERAWSEDICWTTIYDDIVPNETSTSDFLESQVSVGLLLLIT